MLRFFEVNWELFTAHKANFNNGFEPVVLAILVVNAVLKELKLISYLPDNNERQGLECRG